MAHGKTLELREIKIPEPQPLLAEPGKQYFDTEGVLFAEGDPVLHPDSRNRAARRHFFDHNGARKNIVNPASHSRTWWKRVNLVRHWKAQKLQEAINAQA